LNGLENYFASLRFYGGIATAGFKSHDKDDSEDDHRRRTNGLFAWRQWIAKAKVFAVEPETTMLLTLTKNKIVFKRLPFANIFIDAKINFGRETVFGIQLSACKYKEDVSFERVDDGEEYDNIHFFYFLNDTEHPDSVYFEHGMVYSSENLEKRIDIDLKKRAVEQEISFDEMKKNSENVKIFIMNFLDFLNTPDVEVVVRNPNPERNDKRARAGKFPMPERRFVIVKGKIKDYITHLTTGNHWKISFSFWIRGHFRTYRDKRYKLAKDLSQWIFPYVKGRGVLREKNYLVELGK
jgi:hypothetical protein